MLAPIVLFVYNRPYHARRTLESLMANNFADQSTLYIYADGAKEKASKEVLEKIKKTREVIREKQWCKEVHIVEREKNLGLADSVIGGVSDIVNKYGKIIVLEDDFILSKNFLSFMNASLDRYENEERVMQISGYMFPIDFSRIKMSVDAFFLPFTSSWGWATWKRSWDLFDPEMRGLEILKNNNNLREKFDLKNSYPYYRMLLNQKKGEISSWAIRFYLSVFLKKGLVLFPKKTLVLNEGFDGSGVHCVTEIKQKKIDNNFSVNKFCDVVEFPDAVREVFHFLKSQNSIIKRLPNPFNYLRRKLKI
jgi:hypothetical protein